MENGGPIYTPNLATLADGLAVPKVNIFLSKAAHFKMFKKLVAHESDGNVEKCYPKLPKH